MMGSLSLNAKVSYFAFCCCDEARLFKATWGGKYLFQLIDVRSHELKKSWVMEEGCLLARFLWLA